MKKLVFLSWFLMFALLAGQAWATPQNIAPLGTVNYSSNSGFWQGPEALIDELEGTGFHTGAAEPNEFVEVELDQTYDLLSFEIYSQSSHAEGDNVTLLDENRNVLFSTVIPSTGYRFTYDNNGAGFTGVRFIKIESGGYTQYVAIQEIYAYIDGVVFGVNAGDDAVIHYPETFQPQPTTIDETGPVTYKWSMLSGPPASSGNVALGKPVSVSCNSTWYGPPSAVTDGDVGTSFHSCGGEDEWVEVDLMGSYDLFKVEVNGFGHLQGCRIHVLDAGRNVLATSNPIIMDGTTVFNNAGAGFTGVRYILIDNEPGSGTTYIVVSEVRAYEPGPIVYFDDDTAASPVVTFENPKLFPAEFILQVDATDVNTASTATDTVQVTVLQPNDVQTGPHFSVILPRDGQISDVQTWGNPSTIDWAVLDYFNPDWIGTPPSVTFLPNATVQEPELAFTEEGLYTFEVTINQGSPDPNAVVSDTVNAKVIPAGYKARTIISATATPEEDGWGGADALIDDAGLVAFDNHYLVGGDQSDDNWLSSALLGTPVNVALSGTATQSTYAVNYVPGTGPESAIDDNTFTGTHTYPVSPSWIEVDLNQAYDLDSVELVNSSTHMIGAVFKLLDASRNTLYTSDPFTTTSVTWDNNGAGFSGVRYVRLEPGTGNLYLVAYEIRAWTGIQNAQVADQSVELELDQKYDLNYLRLWNFRHTSESSLLGIEDFNVLVKENAGDAYTQIGSFTAGEHPTEWDNGDKSQFFPLDTSAFANGVQFVKVDILSKLDGSLIGSVGINQIALSGTCPDGPLPGDIDGDCDVDLMDYDTLAQWWLSTGCMQCGDADIAGFDGDVDMGDLGAFMSDWLQ